MTNVLEEKRGAGYFIASEGNGRISRVDGVLAEGQNLEVGTILALDGDDKYVQLDPQASDGTEDVAGILFASADASDDDAPIVVINYHAEVAEDRLVYPDGVSAGDIADINAALFDELKIRVRAV